jgi:Flp pilus assembly protein TadG
MLAFVVDLSRMYVQKNELQTGTDAGALAGALRLSASTDNVSDSAVATGNRNFVLGKAPTFQAGAVMCGVWDGLPVNGTTPNTWHAGSPHALPCVVGDNAVQLGGTSGSDYLFNGILNAAAVTIQTTAVAWVAPTVDRTSCIKPLAVDYDLLLKALDTFRGGIARTPPRVLDGIDYNILNTQSAQLTFCLKDGSNGSSNCPNTVNTSGSFNIVGLMPGDNGGNQYGNELGAECSEPYSIGQGDNIDVQTGNIVGQTKQGLGNYCSNHTPCVMKFVMYDNPVTNPSATYPSDKPATDGASCSGQTTGTNVCYKVVTIGAAVIDYGNGNGNGNGGGANNGVITGHFTIAMDPGGSIGVNPGLLKTVILVQ